MSDDKKDVQNSADQKHTPSNITILECDGKGNAAHKIFELLDDGHINKTDYKSGYKFRVSQKEILDINTFFEFLKDLEGQPRKFLIRGIPLHEFSEPVRRIKTKKDNGDGPNFEDALKNLIPIDIDKLNNPGGWDPKTDPDGVARWAVQECLPKIFHSVSFVYQYSSSQGVPTKSEGPQENKVSLHLFFFSDKPISGKALKTYFNAHDHKIDPALFDPIQVIYTSKPEFKGMKDPMPKRIGLVKGNNDVVHIEANSDPSQPQNGNPGIASEIDIEGLRISINFKNLIQGGWEGCSGKYRSRSEAGFAVICSLLRNGYDEATIEPLLLNPKNRISEYILEKSNRTEYLRREIREARDRLIDPNLERLNSKFAFVVVGGRSAILKKAVSSKGHKEIELWNPDAFKQYFCNQFKEVINEDGHLKRKPLGDWWLRHPQRLQYEGIVFNPNEDVSGYYNLWQGFAVEPQPGDCSKFLDHIERNVCRGNPEYFDWLMGWIADIVQNPGRKPGTAVVLRGKQGTGKTIVGEIVGSLLGAHYVRIAESRYITGRFNAHLMACLLLHSDEGIWAGDKQGEGKLKDLITSDRQLIEFKGKESFNTPNYIRVLITGNQDWLVPAGAGERRFAVFDMSEGHMQDHDYFAAIDKEMESGGREALLDYLLKHDLSKVNLRKIPKSSALLDQKLESLDSKEKWWLDLLQRGELPEWSGDGNRCPSKVLFNDYIDHAQKSGVRFRSIETIIGMFLRKAAPGIRKCEGSIYEFPPLKKCRRVFEETIQDQISWDDIERDWRKGHDTF